MGGLEPMDETVVSWSRNTVTGGDTVSIQLSFIREFRICTKQPLEVSRYQTMTTEQNWTELYYHKQKYLWQAARIANMAVSAGCT